MVFNSLEYIIFLLICVLTLRNITNIKIFQIALTLFSWFFYSFLNIKLLLLIFIFSLSCWILSNLIYTKPEIKKIVLTSGIFLILAQLAIFKYLGWFTQIALEFYDLNSTFKIILPIGISFYSFQAISYLVDLSKNKKVYISGFWHLSAYLAFFPQLIAGPIERSIALAPQLLKPKFASHRMISTGLLLIIAGLCKKILLADNLGAVVQYSDANLIQPGFGLLLLIAFSFQIYFDFSAYTDIARGSARILGIKLRVNFIQPYISRSPQEFWKRWHISLSEWIKDYVYIPLRKQGFQYITAIIIAFGLSGLWHGAGFGFIAWGFWNALILLIYARLPKSFLQNSQYHTFQIFLLFILILIGWSFFYSDSTLKFLQIYHSILRPIIYLQLPSLEFYTIMIFITALISPVMYFEVITRGRRSLSDFISLRMNLSGTFILVTYILIQSFYKRTGNEFIYFQF